MRQLDAVTISIRGSSLSKHIAAWLDDNGPRIFTFEGDVFELCITNEQLVVTVNGIVALEVSDTRRFRDIGHTVYAQSVFRDVKANDNERTFYDYAALLRKDVYLSVQDLEWYKNQVLAKFTQQQLTDKNFRFIYHIPTITVEQRSHSSGYKLREWSYYESILWRMELGFTYKEALRSTCAVCIDSELVEEMREKVAVGVEKYRSIVERNIVCYDPATYDDSFNGTDLTDAELEAKNKFNLAW